MLAQSYRHLCENNERLPDVFAFIEREKIDEAQHALEVLLIDQYYRWARGQAVPVEHYLQRLPQWTDHLAVDLLVEEFGYLEDRGLAADACQFVQRFQSLGDDLVRRLHVAFDLDIPSGSSASNPSSFSDTATAARSVGRYEMVCSIGSGSFGEVFLGKDPSLGRSVAIKIPKLRSLQEGETESLLDEARVLASLDHPNIVPIYDMGKTPEGDCFIVSKYIQGKSLKSEIRRSISHLEAARITVCLARALHAAHRLGIVHRDVKPGNILLDADRQPQLLDFGLALARQNHATTGTLVGTPAYMSPEQARHESHLVDGRSDIFSLGVVFYEMLTGRRPIEVDGTEAHFELLESGCIPPPRQFDSSIPDELERICIKALAHRVTNRYSTASDFAGELQQWIARQSSDSTNKNLPHQGLDSDIASSSRTGVRTNLPRRRMQLFGRQQCLEDVSAWLTRRPLVTIVGTGGVGKTSLAIEAGNVVQNAFPGGVWLCEFASANQASDLMDLLLQTLPKNSSAPISLDQLLEGLDTLPTLLIFDNCEHLIDDVAGLAKQITTRTAHVTVLATSREPLGMPEEQVIQLSGISFSTDQDDARQMFLQRAGSIGSYEFLPEDTDQVDQIVRKLEGLPLAIELAAAQLTSMTVTELLRALDNQIETLQVARSGSDRQSSVISTIDWSFHLLTDQQQSALMSLSVFAGAFSMDAAESVIGSGLPTNRLLQRLVEQSMLVRTKHCGKSRFRLLEPIRQYCQHRITPQHDHSARRNHAYYFANRAAWFGGGVYGFDELEVVSSMELEWADLRQAVAWGREHRMVEVAVDPILEMDRMGVFHGRDEIFRWLSQAIEVFGDTIANRHDVIRSQGSGVYLSGDFEKAIELLQQSLATHWNVEAKFMLGISYFGAMRLQQWHEESKQWYQWLEENPEHRESRFASIGTLFPYLMTTTDLPGFEETLEKARRQLADMQWLAGEADLLLIAGLVFTKKKKLERAATCLQQGIEVAEKCGCRLFTILCGTMLEGLGISTSRSGDRLTSAIKYLKQMGEVQTVSDGVSHLPVAARTMVSALVEAGHFEMAARTAGFAAQLRGAGELGEYSPHYGTAVDKINQTFDREHLQQLQKEGAQLTTTEIISACEGLLEKSSSNV